MCSRHLAHAIAEYEAARLDGETPDEAPAGEGPDSPDVDDAGTERGGFLRAVAARLAQ